MSNEQIIGNKEILKAFNEATDKLLKNKKGSILALKGEEGYGKSFLLNHLYNQVSDNDNIIVAFADNQSPISQIKHGDRDCGLGHWAPRRFGGK